LGRCVNCKNFTRATCWCGWAKRQLKVGEIHKAWKCSGYELRGDGVRRWILKAAGKEQNPHFQNEFLYQALGNKNEKEVL
jgi:hypothetical protein